MLKTIAFILIPLFILLHKNYNPIIDITDEFKINKEGYFENVKGIILKDTITHKMIIDGFAKNYNIKNSFLIKRKSNPYTKSKLLSQLI